MVGFSFSTMSRTSQFIISLNKYLEALKNNFSVGLRFKMKFEGDEAPEKGYAFHRLSDLCCFSCWYSALIVV